MVEIEQVGEITEQDLLDCLVEQSGHVAPPADYITVDQYLARVQEKGVRISRNTALQTLLEKRQTGQLEGRKMSLNGRQRWVFWAANHDGENGG